MICLRCGYCCIYYIVVVVDNPDKGFEPGNFITHEPGNDKPCKHLIGGKPGNYSCAVHDRAWYPNTPCYTHTQVERGNTPCRMGEYILERVTHTI